LHAGLSNAVTATFLALLVACLGRFLARRPAVLHCLWLLVLLKLVTPPLYEVPIPWPKILAAIGNPDTRLEPVLIDDATKIGGSVVTGSGLVAHTERPSRAYVVELLDVDVPLPAPGETTGAVGSIASWLSFDWMPAVATVWLVGSVVVLAVSAKRAWQFHCLLREAEPASEEIEDRVSELAFNLGLSRPPSVWWASGKLAPLVWALGWRPRLIIPIDLWKTLGECERSTLIVHELAHLRRGDHRVRIFELVVTALFWWHPVLWWARQSLRDVEEQCCDAWVVWAFPDFAKSYAETLLETLDFLNQSDQPVPLLASGFGKVDHLRRRLTMIMSGTTPRLLGIRGALAAVGLAALLLPVNATWAQKPEEQKEIKIIVKTDDDKSDSPLAFAVTDDHNVVLEDVIINTDDLKSADGQGSKVNQVVRLNIKTDDSSINVTAGSMKEALERLKEQIKILSEKASPSEREKVKKALENVYKQLENQHKDLKVGKSGVLKLEKALKPVQLHIRSLDDKADKNAARGSKAEIEKARARVEAIRKDVEAKHKELAEAQRKLSELTGNPHTFTYAYRVLDDHLVLRSPDAITKPDVVHGLVLRREDIKGPAKPGEKPTVLREYVVTDDRSDTKGESNTDSGRIAKLEKKLRQLLEEVANLKNDRAK
jgi:beta-lactamase regulating signal transducer with metallopeptidase domain